MKIVVLGNGGQVINTLPLVLLISVTALQYV